MMNCEIYKNIVNQRVDIYLISRNHYFKYDNGEITSHTREDYTVEQEPFLSIPYDIWDYLVEAFKRELDIEKLEGSASHIKDLRWVIEHFMSKDK